MDYYTKPTSRKELRMIAQIFRHIFGLSEDESIDPSVLLDKMSVTFSDVSYEIVQDSELPFNIPAVTELLESGGYLIKIKESIYLGATYRKVGGYRMHLVHEMAHVLLDKLGYKPIFTRDYIGKIEPMYSLEWKAKALAGEIMIPYEHSKNMNLDEIMDIYGVSVDAAKIRLTY